LSSETITRAKIQIKSRSNLIDQALEAISKTGENGIFQTDLCKTFSLDSRDGSRLVGNLEKQSLISREKTLHKGRWTYKLVTKKPSTAEEFSKKPIEIVSIEGAPCLRCTYQHLCSSEDEASQYSPAKCIWIEEWIMTSFNRPIITQQNSETSNL
jgi:hypothetical protein